MSEAKPRNFGVWGIATLCRELSAHGLMGGTPPTGLRRVAGGAEFDAMFAHGELRDWA